MNREQAQCLLGVAGDASRQEIVSAHRRLVSTVHPDKCDGPEAGRLARQATEAREVLLAPVRTPSRAVSSSETGGSVDDVLLRHVRVVVDGTGAPLAGVDLYRRFRADLRACGVSAEEARVCSARVLDDDFLAAGAARGYWELDGDGVRPVGWTESPAGSRAAGGRDPHGGPEEVERAARRAAYSADPVGEVRRWVEDHVRFWFRRVVRWAAAVAAASMFALGGNFENPNKAERSKRPDMKGPSDISDLLSGLKTKSGGGDSLATPKPTVIEDNGSSTISISELKEMHNGGSAPARSKRRGKSDKNTISLAI